MGTYAISNHSSDRVYATRLACKATVLAAILLLMPLLAGVPTFPIEESPKMTSGRSTDPDVAVTDLNVTTPSAMVSGVPTLAPQNHIIRVSIVNIGGGVGEGDLILRVGGVDVDTRDVSINPGQQEVHLLLWDATNVSGAQASGLNIVALWDAAGSDSDSSNDQTTLSNVDVSAVESASDIADSLPGAGDSLARAQWQGAITVVNTGNQPVNVSAQLTLTPTLGGSAVSITSTTEQINPGSLSSPPEPVNVSISFDGSNLEGDYTLGGSLLVTGESQSVVNIPSRLVNFVALRATLIPANNRNVDPGSSTILNFILQNSGDTDTFTVTQSNTSAVDEWWANVSQGDGENLYTSSDPLTVLEDQTQSIQVPIEVPADAANGDAVVITISVQSIGAGYVLEANTIVMAGGTYESEIFQNHSYIQPGTGPGTTPAVPAVYVEDYANITPGTARTLDYTLRNTGTAPAQFQISVGATEAVPYWTIHCPITMTDVLLPNENRTIPVTITTPELEMPLNPSWKVSSIEEVDIVIQAVPMEGGIPSTNQTTLVIDSVVELDIKITGTPSDVSVDDVLGGNTDRYVPFEVTIVHNLGSDDTLAQVSLVPSGGEADGKTFDGDTPQSDASTSEHTRWIASIGPGNMELEPGEIGYGFVGISFNANEDFPYPAAGTFTFDFIATSNWASFTDTISKNASANITFKIEELWSAELISGPVVTGDPSVPMSAQMTLKNTGNDVANFTVGFIEIPGWDISLASKQVNMLKSRTNLFPNGVDRNPEGDMFTINVNIVPPSTASADGYHEIWIYVNGTDDSNKNTVLAAAPAFVNLTKVISAELSPTKSVAVIDSGESRVGQKTIILQLNNTGNSNVTYDLTLTNYDSTRIQVSFADDGTETYEKQQSVAPGAQAIVRIYATAGSSARADEDSRFDMTVEHDGTLLATSEITVQVAPDHAIIFIAPSAIQVAPGNTVEIPYTLTNLGNLVETLNLTAEFPEGAGNWSYSVNDSNFSIAPEESYSVMLTITLPGLNEGGSILEAYMNHSVIVRAVNITDPFPTWPTSITVNGTSQPIPVNQRKALGGGVPAGTNLLTVEILPVFDVQLIKAPDRIALVPGIDRVIHYELENKGNAMMDLTISWETIDTDTEPRFGVEAIVSSTSLSLAVGETTSLTFRFSTLGGDHYKDEPGTFILTRTPVGVDVDPQQDSTPIIVVRAQTDEEILLNADTPGNYQCVNNDDDRCREIRIPWVNINPSGSTNAAERAYSLGLNGKIVAQPGGGFQYDASTDLPERLVSSSAYKSTHWSLSIDHDTSTGSGQCVLLDDQGTGITATESTLANCNSQWDLLPTTPYDLEAGGTHGGTIVVQVQIPLSSELAAGDGWDIYLQLRNPEEDTTTEFSTDLVLKIRMSQSTNPQVNSVEFRGGGVEGDSTFIDVNIINAGNAVMPSDVQISLNCPASPYITITGMSSNKPVPALPAAGNHTASWPVKLNPIPWYSSSVEVECTASIIIPSDIVQQGGIFGNVLSDDAKQENIPISSWSTPSLDLAGIGIPSAALAFLVLLFGALSLLRQGMDDDQDRLHASAYVASIAFGALSLSAISTILTIICAIGSILFAGLVAWLSSSELQAIHDDRKKSRIGTRALIEDHDKEQANTRKELRAIISCAPIAFLPFVLITPELAIDLGAMSLISVIGFMALSPVLVHLILRFLDGSYDRLYRDLADIELRAIRIKKILGRAGKKSD